jgi:hypothetical protein
VSTSRSTTPMDPTRKAALVAGVLYLVTFATSIPALGLYDGVLNDPNFVLGAGSETGVLWGALLEVVLGLACIGTAVAVYPVIKRHGESRALGFVASRTVEAAMIFVGVLSLLAVLTLRQDLAGTGADTASLLTTSHALVAVHDWTFLVGPGVMPAINALCFAVVLRRSGLVPRIIPTIGLVGAPLLLASSTASLFGAYDQVSTPALLAALPIAAWELSVGVYMAVKGFRPVSTTNVTVEPAAPADHAHAVA